MNRTLRTTLIAAAIAAASGAAFAQGHARGEHAFTPAQRTEARLAYLKTALKITDAQQPQWNAFAESERRIAAEREGRMKEWREKMSQRREAGAQEERQRPSAIDRLSFAEKRHAEAAKHIDAQLTALKPLYAALTPEQKKVADEVLAPHRPHGFGRHGGPRGRA